MDPANLVNVVVKDVTVTVTAPKPAATITAQDIILGKGESGEGGSALFRTRDGPGDCEAQPRSGQWTGNQHGGNIFDRNNTTIKEDSWTLPWATISTW